MLDINFIRDNKEIIEEAIRKRRMDFDVNALLKVDIERRDLIQGVETKKAEQNKVTEKIPNETDLEKKTELIGQMKDLKAEIQKEEKKLKEVMERWHVLMLQVPNIPDPSVPEGDGEEDNLEVSSWGKRPKFDFEPKDHIELMIKLGMVDFERGVKVHGFRGYFLKGGGADLSWAIWNFARDFYRQKGFESFLPPSVVRPQYFYATGHLPAEAEDLYKTQDDDYFSGTSEVSMMGLFADETLTRNDLPFKALAFSPCYRREAGSHGKDTRGLVRVNEFYKLEQLVLCEASHVESDRLHEEMTRSFEEFLEHLEIPHRRLQMCTGDLSASKVKQYDIEAWVPSEGSYRELASASYFHDFQTRRFGIKYKNKEGKSLYAHSLNNTAAATPRLLVALLENHQQADGSIILPPALQKYYGKTVISS